MLYQEAEVREEVRGPRPTQAVPTWVSTNLWSFPTAQLMIAESHEKDQSENAKTC